MKKYKDWTLIAWDGNPSLELTCWRKSFPGGHVSIGAGDFNLISYSYGPNSENSIGSTRYRHGGLTIAEEQAKALVDKNKGHWVNEN